MTIALEDRPTDVVREEVIDQLILNYSHGKLSEKAFESRLDQAMASENNTQIAKLAEDLEQIEDERYVASKKHDLGVNYHSAPSEDTQNIVSIFGGSNLGGRWTLGKKIRSISIFGGSDIDLTDAQFSRPQLTIQVFCLFGGDNIYVPENVNVVSSVFCIFGGIDNKAQSLADRHAPTITIEGIALFAGVTIKIKRTVKEKFVAFADKLKQMLS
jgi:hypothetical protein